MVNRAGQVWRADDGTVFLVVGDPRPHVLGAAHDVLMLHLGPEAGRELATSMHEGTIPRFEEREGWERLS